MKEKRQLKKASTNIAITNNFHVNINNTGATITNMNINPTPLQWTSGMWSDDDVNNPRQSQMDQSRQRQRGIANQTHWSSGCNG